MQRTTSRWSFNLSWVWIVLMILGTIIISLILVLSETHSWLGVGVAFAVVVLGIVCSLIGFIPIIGQVVYIFAFWPWVQSHTIGFYPLLSMPVTLTVIFVLTTLLSIVWSTITVFLLIITHK